MKKVLIIMLAVFFTAQLHAQTGVSISDDASEPQNCAQLEVKSTTKGFLPPAMTEVQRNGISNPATGLQVFNTTSSQPNYYNGSEWMNFDGTSAATPLLAVGDFAQGGVVFYILEEGDNGYDAGVQHGLVCAVADETSIAWGCEGTDIAGIPTEEDIDVVLNADVDGLAYSNAINTECGISTAAGICLAKTGDYSDWYLPTMRELKIINDNKIIITETAEANGGTDFIAPGYWSSSEKSNLIAWIYHIAWGSTTSNYKNDAKGVRPVRAF